jgi:hypothetical protein
MLHRAIIELAHDLACRVDPSGKGGCGAGDIDGSERGTVPQKAMPACGITEDPYDLAPIVNPESRGDHGTRNINDGEGIRGVLGCDNGTEHDT